MNSKVNFIYGPDNPSNEIIIKKLIDSETKKETNFKIIKKEWTLKWEKNSLLIEEIVKKDFFQKKIIIIDVSLFEKTKPKERKIFFNNLEKSKHFIILNTTKKFRGKLWETFIKIGNFYETKKVTAATKKKFIKNYFDEKKILYEKDVLNFLTENFPNNLNLIKIELNKIKNYLEITLKPLTLKLIPKIINLYPVSTIFPLIENLLKNDREKIILNYQKIKNEIKPLIFIAVLQTYLLWMKKIIVLKENNFENYQILTKYNNKRFFLFNLLKLYNKIKVENINLLINKIYSLEYQLKTNDFDSHLLLENYLIV